MDLGNARHILRYKTIDPRHPLKLFGFILRFEKTNHRITSLLTILFGNTELVINEFQLADSQMSPYITLPGKTVQPNLDTDITLGNVLHVNEGMRSDCELKFIHHKFNVTNLGTSSSQQKLTVIMWSFFHCLSIISGIWNSNHHQQLHFLLPSIII